MEENKNPNNINLAYKRFEGKNLIIMTADGLRYTAHDFKVINDTSVLFVDKFNNEIMMSIFQIRQITEVKE